MGYTTHTVGLIEKVIREYNPKTVIDLGAQNLYNQPLLPAPYASTWWEAQGIKYSCIDLNGENNAIVFDLSTPVRGLGYMLTVDVLTDIGTCEHIGKDGKFDWASTYNCWLTKHSLLRIGGIMINENPKQNNWPLHGFSYQSQEFYNELTAITDYQILVLGEHAACGNVTDGWNIHCVLKKRTERFPTLDEFKKLSLYQS